MICFSSAVGRRRDIWARYLFELRHRWAERHLSPAICLSSATGERRDIWDYILLSGKALSIKNIPIRCHYTEFWKLCKSNQAALRGFVLKHCFCLIFSLWCLPDREDSLWCKKSIYCCKKEKRRAKHPPLSFSFIGRETPALFESISLRPGNACFIWVHQFTAGKRLLYLSPSVIGREQMPAANLLLIALYYGIAAKSTGLIKIKIAYLSNQLDMFLQSDIGRYTAEQCQRGSAAPGQYRSIVLIDPGEKIFEEAMCLVLPNPR